MFDGRTYNDIVDALLFLYGFSQRIYQTVRQNDYCNVDKQVHLYASALEFHLLLVLEAPFSYPVWQTGTVSQMY